MLQSVDCEGSVLIGQSAVSEQVLRELRYEFTRRGGGIVDIHLKHQLVLNKREGEKQE